MSKLRGTSNVPMVMGIIGGVLGLPGAVCAGACTAGLTAAAGSTNSSEIGNFYLGLGIAGAVIGLMFGILSKRFPKTSGFAMLAATFMSGLTLIAGNLIALIVTILFLIGAVFSFVQKKEEIA